MQCTSRALAERESPKRPRTGARRCLPGPCPEDPCAGGDRALPLDRPPWLNLPGAFAATACTTIGDAQALRVVTDYLAWAIAGAMVLVAANYRRLLRKTAAR